MGKHQTMSTVNNFPNSFIIMSTTGRQSISEGRFIKLFMQQIIWEMIIEQTM